MPTVSKLAATLLGALAFAQGAAAFTISDIRVEGISRTEPGTVFSHLPFRAGDEYTAEKGTRAIHALYASGLFRDVMLTQDGDVLVVHIVERPAVATIETSGIKAFDKDAVEKSLRDVGMAEGRIFDQAVLERADQELRRQYLARGYYGVSVKTTVTPLERNRVRITISVDEGRASSISAIRFVGNKTFDNDELADLMQLGVPNWFSWYTKRDLYSREKLAADLESIRSFYMNQGYLDFKIDSVQVSIAPNKSDVYVTINMTEGEKYTVNDVRLTGDLLGLDSELQALITLEKGEMYNAEKVKNVSSAITDKLATLGYAFATANASPISDAQGRTVDIVYTVDPGRRAYVRRVNITGNNRTRDEVIRREVRQYEAAWFNSDLVKLSRDRIDRLGYFESVTAEPKPVPGTRDQVDLEVNVKERPTGSISLGAGYSTSEGIILSAGFAQNNVFGTGNSVSVDVNTSKSQRTIALSVVQPYITPEGISRSWDVYDRSVDLKELEVADVKYDTRGFGVSWGIPFTELDRVFLGGRFEMTDVKSNANSPWRYQNYEDKYGDNPMTVALTLGWSRDSRDNSLAPTRGVYQRLNGEFALPGFDIQYYKATYQYQQYIPLSRTWTLAFNGEVGWGDVYGKTDEFPFFKNFYAGGIGSVRGYNSGSLGPKEYDHDPYDGDSDNLGGDRMLTGSIEILAPLPGGDRTLRVFGFLDAGYVWGYEGVGVCQYRRQSMSLSDLRYSTGIGVAWISPLGPLKFSIAAPLNDKDGDDIQRFQFQIGTGF
ncbi:outer membrane protein assembly factor BamA [Sutterella parvirubra]|uniref:Outer membrane protein assembly factor BamA n=1 Tax=Sutterella parvirubra YIT 11816 TaxID=762967 RepID=H3KHN3_9BURK|nr:outer membrane protein assembly factor BamA [Sutterella parvirubra]EHY30372.1 outer membrane protein assembly complex, YaeT protein [Sutterella parvirubra YIT 11816]